MPRKRKAEQQPIGVGLTAKQMKRKKPINADMLRDIEPLTENQQKLFVEQTNVGIEDFLRFATQKVINSFYCSTPWGVPSAPELL